MNFYRLPETLDGEIEKFDADIGDFRSGELNPIAFKGIRVAHGIYEQRKEATHMVRIRCPGGAITPTQLRQVSEVSKRYGAPEFHVTTRGELQLHYVDIEDIISVYNELKTVGLSSRGGGGNTIRNIMASYDSGVNPDEAFDVAPYAWELTSRLIAEQDSWNLPRKFKIAFSNTSEDTANATITCLGFIASMKDGQRGFKVYVGGGMGAAPMPGVVLYDWVPDTEVYYIARAMKVMFDKHGDRRRKHQSRFKFVVKKLGIDEVRRLIDEERAQLEEGLELKLDEIENAAATDISVEVESAEGPEFELWKKRYVRNQKQDGLITVKVPLKLGDIFNGDGVKLADFLEPFGDNVIRLALDQNLHLRNIPEAYVGNIYHALNRMHTLSATPIMIGSMIACTGADTCKLGICLPRGVVPRIADRLLNSELDLNRLDDVRIHISGCPNTCGRHHAADLGFFGKVMRVEGEMLPAYYVLAGAQIKDGGTRFAEQLDEVCSKHIPEFVHDLFERYLTKADSYSSFNEYVSNGGKEDIHELAKKWSELPTIQENEQYYFDWGAVEQFSLLKGQKAECSAGVFDMIGVDQGVIKASIKALDATEDPAEVDELLYKIVFASSRMLLVTRGLEIRRDEQAFEYFQQHFINSDLIPQMYSGVVGAGKDRDFAALNRNRDQVIGLGEAVQELYKTMDDSLRFSATAKEDEKAAEEGGEGDADVFKDFRGVGCPMNFVKTKIAMDPMDSGQTLEILLDDGAPIQNVPNSVKLEGHEILGQDQREDGHWSVLIKKA